MVLKSDSYVVESNIHFPTDISLAWDSARKCNDVIFQLQKRISINGWRKRIEWRKKLKRAYRKLSDVHSKKGANYTYRLEKSTRELLNCYTIYSNKIKQTLEALKPLMLLDIIIESLGDELKSYHIYLEKFIDQLDRRILQGQSIPHQEKIFSIFEPHVEWIKKGKPNNRVELGHNVLITTDQHHFIIDHHVMVDQRDNSQPQALIERLKGNYPKLEYSYKSLSFDRGFYSKLTKANMGKEVNRLILPKKGKKTKAEKEEESHEEFRHLQNQHSAVESNINELERGGVNKVPDKGLNGFKKYVALGILAHNIKRLGKYLKEERA